jgi:hypothetical protein
MAQEAFMKLKQLSVFLENAPGRLYEATLALAEAGLNIRVLSICDTSDFGVLRLVVSDLATARRVIMEKHLPARVDDVIVAEIEDTPGSLARVLYLFKEAQINVEYMYSLAGTGTAAGKAALVFRFSDNDRAVELLQDNRVKLLDAEALGILEQGV